MVKVSSRTNYTRKSLGNLTIAELQETPVEYERVPAICRRFGVTRPFVFYGFQNGVKNIHVKKPGATKGVRLVSVSSMREFIESFGS